MEEDPKIKLALADYENKKSSLEKKKNSLTEQLAEVDRELTDVNRAITVLKEAINILEKDSSLTASKSITNQNRSLQEEVSSDDDSLWSISRSPREMLRKQYRNLSYVDATIRYLEENLTIGSVSIEELMKALFVWQTPEELARIRASYTAEIRRRGIDEGKLEIDPQTKGKRPQRYRLCQKETDPINNRD